MSTSQNFDGPGDVEVSTEPAGAPSYAFTGLVGNTTYHIQVRAVNYNDVATEWVYFTSTRTPVTAVPDAPTIEAVYTSSITASWNLVGGATGYTLVASTKSTTPPFIWSSSITIGGSDIDATVFENNELNPNTTYFLFVRTNYNEGSSNYSNYTATSTLAVEPAAPVGVSTFTNVAGNGFTINWSSGTEITGYNSSGTTYDVERSTSQSFNGSGDVEFSTEPAGAPSYTFTTLSANTTYYVQIRAVNV